ncbi:MAG: transcription-repair coupling factor [Streptosporangiaceae bacterium]
MSLSGLLGIITADPQLRAALEQAAHPAAGGGDLIGPAALRPMLAAALTGYAAAGPQTTAQPGPAGRFVLAVTATAREAEDLAAALGSLLPPSAVGYFPAWETLPHERLSPRSDTSGQRLAVLRRLASPDPADPRSGPLLVVTTPVRSLLQPMVGGLGDLVPVSLAPGQAADLEETVTRLVDIGYARVEMVGKRGEIAVRGGILDVFPPTEEHPLRIEFWGNEIEEVRYFKVADQRSLETAADGLWAPPCRELLLTPSVRARARELAREWPGLGDVLARLADGITVEGMEALAPALTDRMELLLDYVPPGGLVLACDPERIRARAADLVSTSQEFLEASWLNAAAGGQVPVDLGGAAFRAITEVRSLAADLSIPWWTATPFAASGNPETDPSPLPLPSPGDPAGEPAGETGGRPSFRIDAVPAGTYRGDTSRVLADVTDWLSGRWRVVLVTEGHGPAQRLAELLRGEGLGARTGDLDQPGATPEPGIAQVTTGMLDGGFVWPSIQLAVLSEADMAGHRPGSRETRRMPSRRRGGIDPLRLAPGDYIVHEQHGVGRYLEMTSRTVQGATRDYLVIEYAPSRRGHPADRLYLPTDQLDEVTRYTGGEAPALHRLGGADWAKAKGRARKAVRDIAAGLIRLYQARMASPGHAFGPDTPWQRELEDAFPYVETPDQLAAVDEVKADMQKAVPMDRLICGDVGYGKTEVALRAAFKAASQGKQVLMLAPTTILAQQHYGTFSERLADYPINVEHVSRFRSAAEQREAIAGFAAGRVDILIGTHRVLSRDVRAKDLGLLILDEEQRFGVKQKELLRQLKLRVDVISMSATPIPRTLQMSLAGLREISVIETPPEGRRPVKTYVGEYEEELVKRAIRREHERDGQAFFLHNRVESIDETAERLRALCPGVRFAVAHGQMTDGELETVMMDYLRGESDVLVCTSIIESGIDIPQANTLIVEHSDAFGLSQLYQIRGRVGRSRERAYAYLMYDSAAALTPEAAQRLAALSDYTELGAGFKVAMRDLELRGAGNLLGDEQSGHVAALGFELYMQMLDEAVRGAGANGDGVDAGAAAEGEELPEPVRLDVNVDAYIPTDYVPYEQAKIEIHRRVAGALEVAEVEQLREELEDRFGPVPEPLANLLALQRARIKFGQAGATVVSFRGERLAVTPIELDSARARRLREELPEALYESGRSQVSVRVPREGSARFPTVIRAADVLLALKREAA